MRRKNYYICSTHIGHLHNVGMHTLFLKIYTDFVPNWLKIIDSLIKNDDYKMLVTNIFLLVTDIIRIVTNIPLIADAHTTIIHIR